LFGLLLILLSGGCASAQRFRVIADVDANQNTATRLDLLVVRDTGLVSSLPRNSPDWFAHKDALIARFGTGMEVVSLELPPGTVIDQVPLPRGFRQADTVVYFANYRDADAHSHGTVRLDHKTTLRLTSTTTELSSR
jgi:type VI secretion system protein